VLARIATHRYALRFALGALAVALLAYGRIANAPTARRPAPPLPARALSGAPVKIASLRGHPAVIVFFASWCDDCKHEAPAVARFARSPAGRGRVVAVDYNDGGDWRRFLRRYGWGFPVLDDSSGETGSAFRIPGLPTVVFLDSKGRIVSTSSLTQTVGTLTRGLAAAA
jgi:cytochrome c biogenesis protein CcmG/thiol:disulfide interchange protein DsbE